MPNHIIYIVHSFWYLCNIKREDISRNCAILKRTEGITPAIGSIVYNCDCNFNVL
ncbi:hypothetical protein HMPREF0262_03280 [Clostridium sp. ATCC 29733]|nr:hypothetical protein HMPREF0262_03280 [Clostridium sp. ATCC 29733]